MTFSWEFANTPAGRVLKAIQMRGKASIKAVAADLGVTTSAVRMHLAQLQASGAIRADKVREGVGRPHFAYSLTPDAHNLFYKDYGDLLLLADGEVQLDQRGVAVEIERTSEGFVLREYGCPYQNVAVKSRAVCEMEREVMARLLESGVTLTQYVLDGHRGCQFTIGERN